MWPKPPSSPAEGGNYIVSLFDVRRALRAIPEGDRNLIELRFKDGLSIAQMALLFDTSRATVERRIRRAIRVMSEYLGGKSPWH